MTRNNDYVHFLNGPEAGQTCAVRHDQAHAEIACKAKFQDEGEFINILKFRYSIHPAPTDNIGVRIYPDDFRLVDERCGRYAVCIEWDRGDGYKPISQTVLAAMESVYGIQNSEFDDYVRRRSLRTSL